MEEKIIRIIWFVDEHWRAIVGTTLGIVISPIILYLIYLVYDYVSIPTPTKRKTKGHCYSCGGKLKFHHMEYYPLRMRLYKCTQCGEYEWVLCKNKHRRFN